VNTPELVCARDRVPTRLRCAKCEAGICPACLVRTPIGYRCPTCAGAGRERRGRRPIGLAVAGAAVLAVLLAVVLLRPAPGPHADPVAVVTPGTAAPSAGQAMIGEEAVDGQLVFLVQDFSCDPAQLPVDAALRSGRSKLCFLRVSVRNTSGSPALFLGRFQYLLDGQARTYGPDEALSRAVPENANRSLTEVNVNPDVTVPMVLLFDIPDTVEPVEAQFKGTGRSRIGINVRLQRR
jgi:hypothetical protein